MVSTTAHVAALVWLGHVELPAAATPPEPAGDPVEVELLPAPPPRSPTPEPAPLRVARVSPEPAGTPAPPALPHRTATLLPPPIPRPAAIATPPDRDGPPAEPAPAGGGSALAMRGRPGPEWIDHGGEPAAGPGTMSPAEAARVVEPDLGAPPPPSPLDLPGDVPRPPPSELRPDGNGTYRKDDLVFTAKVDRSGRVHIEDKPNVHASLHLPGPRTLLSGLMDWYEDPRGYATRDERAIETHTYRLIDGGFDATDALMRANGEDPYYYRKAGFLDRTREERAAMSRVETTENLRDSLAKLPGFLAELWRYPRWSPRERRQVLFELWDECAESGSDEVVTAARTARATIVAFIRRHLGPDSPARYTEQEIAELNAARRSKQEFAPYRNDPAADLEP